MMCKHFQLHGFCQMNEKCHFAHGKEELRTAADPLPQGASSPIPQKLSAVQYTMPPQVTNYKTMKCKYHEKGYCKYGNGCSFAHGEVDLRPQGSPVPQQALNIAMQVKSLDAGQNEQANTV
eukprot:CAMPEP_0114582492 /NCGR_PEP_ID=MMETSP0125-20121206/6457_1 /TAXON_ID=485358 ORGANISM="Aristerostoma sp., Strain ATCC 50986" /NCGR_SAMPLE_ID=MMETSP0125 /ASSEMBLY_ACC=CAM_ASM_000245 /LENGTH=120 /DNA_ID=CAMNT_0001775467 /DNA_START=84 /DNA_END=446 /DNA_ORIENTATION=-